MPQGFKNRVKSAKGVKTHVTRKDKPAMKKADGWKARSNKQLTKNINRNLEEVIIAKAKESKIRLKVAGQNRKKK